MKATLHNLIKFVPKGEEETQLFNSVNKTVLNKYLDDTKTSYNKGQFYLGGQIKTDPNEEITLENINEVREITKRNLVKYGGPCNFMEASSIANSERMLNEIECVIKIYLKIVYLRELDNLGKLNIDVNNLIVDFT